MKNRAKCKKCESIIESFYPDDYVTCRCGAIFVDGGNAMRCGADDWSNFLRVDDNGNTIVVTVKDKEGLNPMSKPSKEDIRGLLSEMIKNYENLPQQAMTTGISHYDYLSLLLLLEAILAAD